MRAAVGPVRPGPARPGLTGRLVHCARSIDFKTRTIELDGELIKLQLWDTAGQERFRHITPTFVGAAAVVPVAHARLTVPRRAARSFYRGAHGVMVVYDVTSADSFVNVRRWLDDIDLQCAHVGKVLGTALAHRPVRSRRRPHAHRTVGNKIDMPDRRVVHRAEAERFAKQTGVPLWETSAKTGENVYDAFKALAMVLCSHRASPCGGRPPAHAACASPVGAEAEEAGFRGSGEAGSHGSGAPRLPLRSARRAADQ